MKQLKNTSYANTYRKGMQNVIHQSFKNEFVTNNVIIMFKNKHMLKGNIYFATSFSIGFFNYQCHE